MIKSPPNTQKDIYCFLQQKWKELNYRICYIIRTHTPILTHIYITENTHNEGGNGKRMCLLMSTVGEKKTQPKETEDTSADEPCMRLP